jgi:hypothetical protein
MLAMTRASRPRSVPAAAAGEFALDSALDSTAMIDSKGGKIACSGRSGKEREERSDGGREIKTR